jgi:polar amino acid transport system substrate-binding protein
MPLLSLGYLRRPSSCLCALILLGWLAGSSAAQEPEGQPKPLRWGADAEGGAPFIFKDQKNPGRNIGFEVDLAAAMAKELKRPIEFTAYEFKNLIPGLERGDFDFAMNGLEITPDRLARVRFSKPYYAYKLQLVLRPEETRFQSLEGIRKAKGLVGTLEDTAAERLLDARGVRKRIYDGQVEPYLDLAQGQVDAVLLDLPIARYYARKSPVTPVDPNLKFVGDLVGRGYYAIAFRKKDEVLARQFDAALERLFASGELRRIYRKWDLWNDSQEEFLPPGYFFEDDQAPASELMEGEAGGFFMLLLRGAGMTVLITVCSFVLAVVLALPIAVARLYGPPALSWLAWLYVEFFRGIPVLLLLAFLYYGLPEIANAYDLGVSLKMDALTAAVLGFGLNYAAYEAEIYRAGISNVPTGQWEAAASLGMSPALTFRRIIFPQAIRTILPPTTNDLVAMFKDTSVVSVIALNPPELTKEYLLLTKSGVYVIEVALATAALYLIMSVPLGYLSRYLERRWGAKG